MNKLLPDIAFARELRSYPEASSSVVKDALARFEDSSLEEAEKPPLRLRPPGVASVLSNLPLPPGDQTTWIINAGDFFVVMQKNIAGHLAFEQAL